MVDELVGEIQGPCPKVKGVFTCFSPNIIKILISLHGFVSALRNSPVSRKLKYLWNIREPQLTMVVQHSVAIWRP